MTTDADILAAYGPMIESANSKLWLVAMREWANRIADEHPDDDATRAKMVAVAEKVQMRLEEIGASRG